MTTYTFKNKQYNVGDLEDMNRQQLADLYNDIAESQGKKALGLASTKTAAVSRTLKALKSLGTAARVETPKKAAPAPKPEPEAATPDRPVHVPMAARARPIKRLTTHLLCTIKKVKAPAVNQRLKFWDKYEDGMSLAHVVTTNGLDDTQVRYWVKIGCMKLVRPSDADIERQLDLFNKEGRLEN